MSSRKNLLSLLPLVLLNFVFANAAQISESDLFALTKQEVDNESERLFEYVKTSSDGVRLGCKGKVTKGRTGEVQALFIEDSRGRREMGKLGPITATVRNLRNEEENKYIPLREFPMYCLERVFTSSTCPPGPPGKMGRDGRNGTIGAPGSPGYPGRDGVTGANGLPGPKGPPGSPGRAGERGDRGSVGERGVPGPKGPPGARGTDGVDGIAGPPGETGLPGKPGPSGENGIDGVDGTDGIIGLPGPDGLPGISGFDGLPGLPGLSGNNGNNGVNGAEGAKGVDGQPGDNGKCCGKDPSGGWSSDEDDSEVCAVELGAVHDDSEEVEVAESPSLTVVEEESVKAEGKPTFQKPSFWSSSNDMFAPLTQFGGYGFKHGGKNHGKGKHKKEKEEVEEASPNNAPEAPVQKIN